MNMSEQKAIIEAMLFANGQEININTFVSILELSKETVKLILNELSQKYNKDDSGIELVNINENYQLVTKKQYYEYIFPLIDNRAKPTLSNAALETLSIVAYNPKITKSQIDNIRGVNSDGTIYKLLEFELIESAGKLDAPGKPTMYQTTNKFLKMFGINSLDELPDLPRYKLDENEQIVIDEIIEKNQSE